MSAARAAGEDLLGTRHHRLKDVTEMQPLAASYVVVANETARKAQAQPRDQAIPPAHSRRMRFAAAVASFVRPARRAFASAV